MFRAACQAGYAPGGAFCAMKQRMETRLKDVSALVLNDCNRYARDDTGRLIASSYAASDLMHGVLKWSTPYARRVYTQGTPSHRHNPAASLRWCEKAKSLHKQAWAAQTLRLLGGDSR